MELLVSALLVSGAMITATLLISKSIRALRINQQRTEASLLAQSLINDVKKIQQPLIPLTPPNDPLTANVDTYFADQSEPDACDCRKADFSAMADTATRYNNANLANTVRQGDVRYRRQVCINNVDRTGGAWMAHCPGTALGSVNGKFIRVMVSWQYNGQTLTTNAESLAVRY